MNPRELSREGVLWTWTVQRFAPKSPPYEPPSRGFQPFAVGYVELPEGVRVEAIVEVGDLESLHVGMPVRLAPSTGVPRFVPVTASSRAGRRTEVPRS
jgi:uncharacterized protein